MVRALTAPTLQEADLKEELDAISKIQGEERTGILKHIISYVKETEGEESLQELFKKIEELGHEVPSSEEINKSETDWVKESTITMVGVTAGKLFNWSEEDYIELGKYVMSASLLTKLYFRYFKSLEKTFEHMAETYKQYYTNGEAELAEFDKENKTFIFRIKRNNVHPTACTNLRGVISKLVEMSISSENINVEETKCSFEGGAPYHEYKISW